MEELDEDLGFDSGFPPWSSVSLAPFSPIPSPSPRRLSSQFTQPTHPVPSARRLAYVSLKGRLVNAEEASSARAIGGGLSREEAVAWELFTPIQRFLIVAVIGVAVSESKKNRLISQLKKSVELRDQVLLSMQQKLDNLCEQLNNVKEQPGFGSNMAFHNNVQSPDKETFGSDKINFVDCGCWVCDQHHELFTGQAGDSVKKVFCGDERLQHTATFTNLAEAEQEERRMSDLSDWSSSVTSTAEIQLNNFAIEHDVFSLKKECEEKDATIKELTFCLQSSNLAGSKRISELEDIIRRKNMMISRLKKDMVVLEQKVVNLTRLCRPSSSASSSNSWQLPAMTDNLLYDMDSTTSPSSSDSDSSPVNPPQSHVAKVQTVSIQNIDFASPKEHKSVPAKSSYYTVAQSEHHRKSLSVSPLTELSMNEKPIIPSSPRQRLWSGSGDFKKNRRRIPTASKEAASRKRWM